MPTESTLWIVGVVTLAVLSAVAVTRQGKRGALDAAEASAGQLTRRRPPDSGAATERIRDLGAGLAKRIHFRPDGWAIQPADAKILDEKISILEAAPQTCLRIIGHSDERGPEIYNLALGRRRAVAAKEYLVAHGLDASRVEAVSAGEGHPLARRHDDAAWAENRRDDFKIIDGETQARTEAVTGVTTCPRAS